MSRIEWDSYFDGSMSTGERSRIDSDSDLSRERDGYAAFRNAVHSAGQSEGVPSRRLAEALTQIAAKPSKAPAPTWVLRTAPLVAVLAVIAIWVNRPQEPVSSYDPRALAQTAAMGELPTRNSEEAARWVSSHLGVPAPVLSMKGVGYLILAYKGTDWASYTFVVATHNVVLQMATTDKFSDGDKVTIANRTFYRGKSGLGWRDHGLSFYVTGCGESVLASSASALQDEVKTARFLRGEKARNRVGKRPVQDM